MAKSLLDKLVDSVFDAEWTGKRGEKLTERELKLVSLFGRKGKTLRNIYLPKENGETSEIDGFSEVQAAGIDQQFGMLRLSFQC